MSPRHERRQASCKPPSQPDRKVPAYPAKGPKTPTEPKAPKIKEPKPPKPPKAPKAPHVERREPAFVLPELHRKITVHGEDDVEVV